MNRINFLILAVFFLSLPLNHADAEKRQAQGEEAEEKLPQTGTLSSTGNTGSNDGVWGKKNVLSDEVPPVSGTVNCNPRTRRGVVKVFNNSEDSTYSINVVVEKTGGMGGGVQGRSPYSFTLAPGKQAEREFSVSSTVEDCTLQLRGYTERGKKKKPKKTEDS